MKRTLFIIGGVGIICILAGVWAYFLFFGTPNPDGGVFANFNLGNTDDPSVIIPIEPEPTQPVVDVTSPERLRQLTTQPVAGFAEVQTTANSAPEARYIEAGTGHIYSIDLETGVETRISATTIPLTNAGALTPNGQYALLQSGSGIGSEHVIGIISTTSDELRNFAIPGNITSFAATDDNTFMYATPAGNGLIARAYDPNTNTVEDLFQVPFRDATIAWGSSEAGPHYVYPHTTSRLEGYVYSYTNGVATREPASGYGLSAVGSGAGYIYSEVQDGEYNTYATNKRTNETNAAPLTIIPEKCVFTQSDTTVAVCGISLAEYPYQMPDPWYKGEARMNDSLWEYSIGSQSTSLLVSPENATGRQLDIVQPQFGINDANLYFQNKVDQTLWIYEYNPITNLN
jgi:hypothetical protein